MASGPEPCLGAVMGDMIGAAIGEPGAEPGPGPRPGPGPYIVLRKEVQLPPLDVYYDIFINVMI